MARRPLSGNPGRSPKAPASPPGKPSPRRPESGGRGQGTGSLLDLKHGVRTMKVYPVTESDVRSLKLTSALASLFFSLGGMIIGFGIEIRIGATFYESLPAQAKMMTENVAPLCFWIGAAFLLGAAASEIASCVTWSGVKSSTKDQTLTAGPP